MSIQLTPAEPEISIHAPREGSDEGLRKPLRPFFYISIHAPREGSDCVRCSS